MPVDASSIWLADRWVTIHVHSDKYSHDSMQLREGADDTDNTNKHTQS